MKKIKKLIEAFCDSPYIMQSNYEETLEELQDIFYFFKEEAMEQISDDELIEFLLKIKPYVIFYGNCEIVNTLKQYMTYQTNIKIIYGYRSKHLLYADKILEDMNDSIL